MINVFQPTLGAEELHAVEQVFRSAWIGKGTVTNEFETQFARSLDVDRALVRSTTCCTEGMFQTMPLLGIGEGDEVVLPTVSFVGAANAIAAAGAKPVFCDVDLRTLNPTAASIARMITPRTKEILIIHYGGVPCELDEILALADERGLALVEDSACSVASRYRGRACGTLGDVGMWSFDAMKILVTGDGAMVYCRSEEHAAKLERQLYLGLESKSGFTSSAANKWWEFEISGFGRRAIMNDLTSAIGLEQLKKLPGFIDRRREIHARYDRELSNIDWLQLPPAIPADCESSYYFYWIQMRPELRERLGPYLRDRGVYVTFRYYPLHLVSFYESREPLPCAEIAAHSTLCIPMHQGLSDEDVTKIIECIHDFSAEI